MIALGDLREDHCTTRCRTSSRPARRTSPASSGLARRSTTSSTIDRDAALAHEDAVLEYATARFARFPARASSARRGDKTGVLSFLLEGVHPHDVGTILDQQGVAVRTGQHCAQPVMDRFGIPATIRASLGIYNTREDIDALVTRAAQGPRGVRSVTVDDVRATARCGRHEMASMSELSRSVSRGHPRPQSPAAELSRDRGAELDAGGLQPALRRSRSRCTWRWTTV